MTAAPLRIGIIGLGKFGKLRHRLLSERRDVVVPTFFDPQVMSYPGMTRAASVEELLADPAIDMVSISVPNAFVKDIVIAAVRFGKHVLCEKPPGISIEEARAMHAVQLESPGTRIKFGFNHRFMSHYRRLCEIVQNAEYGKLLWVRGFYGKGFDTQFFETWRSEPGLAGGGIFLDQGIHLLDLMMQLFDGVHVEHAMVDRLVASGPDIEDNVFALLRSTSGVPISLHSSIVHWKHGLRLEVSTEEALIVMKGIKSSTRSFGNEVLVVHSKWRDNFVETHTFARNEADFYTLRAEHDEIIGAIRTNTPLVHGTTKDAVALMAIVSEIYRFRGNRR